MKRWQKHSQILSILLGIALSTAPVGLQAAFGQETHARELYLGPASQLEGTAGVLTNPAAATFLGPAQPRWAGHGTVFRISETASYSYLGGLYSQSWGTAGVSLGYLGYDSIGLVNASGTSTGSLSPYEAGAALHYATPVLFNHFTFGTNLKTTQTEFGDSSRTDFLADVGARSRYLIFDKPVYFGAALSNISPSDTTPQPLAFLVNNHTELAKLFDPSLSLMTGPAVRYNTDGQTDVFWNMELVFHRSKTSFFAGGRYAVAGDLPPLAFGAGGSYNRGPWAGTLSMAIRSNPVSGSDVMFSGQFAYRPPLRPQVEPTKRELWVASDEFDWFNKALELIDRRRTAGQNPFANFNELAEAMDDDGYGLPDFDRGKPLYLPEGPSLVYLANSGEDDWTDKPHTCYVSDGTQISGRIKSVDDARISVTSSFGDIDIPRDRIKRVSDSRLRDPRKPTTSPSKQ